MRIRSEVDRFFSTAAGRALKQLRRLILDGDYDEALGLGRLIAEEVGAKAGVEKEFNRMHSLLRRRLREIEQDDGEVEEREILLRQMADVRPDDVRHLRKLALHLMRSFRYSEAAEIWGRVHSLDPDDQTAGRQKERCTRMAQRRMAAWGGDLEIAT